MPIEPGIALGVRAPEPIDPLRQMVSLANWRTQMESAAALREQRAAATEARNLETERRRRELADQDALGRAYQQPKITRESVLTSLQKDAPHMVPDVIKSFDEADKRATDIRTARANVLKLERDHIAGLAAGVAKHNYDPIAFELALQDAEALFEGQSEMIGRLRERAKTGPDAIRQIVGSLIAGSPEQAQIAETGRHNVVNETTAAAAQAEAARHNQKTEALTATGQAETRRHNQQLEATARRNGEPLEAIIQDGKAVLVPRSEARGKTPATNRERPTEDERKAVGFYSQMRDAMATVDEVEEQITPQELYQIQSLPQEGLIGLMNRGKLSEAAKRYVRAFEQFTEARLRSVSGAAIADSEYARDRRTYAKQYGETPTLNSDRRRAREVQLDSLRRRSGVAMPQDMATPQPEQVEEWVRDASGKLVKKGSK